MLTVSTSPKNETDYLNKFLGPISKLILLLITISIFVPFSPKLPAPGIDPSWALALNQAVAQGLAFGKEIIFTLGPYSSVYTKYYHPATDLMMIVGSLYLAIAYWMALILLSHNKPWYWHLIICVPLFGMIYARDSLFFSYALLIGSLCFKFIESKKTHTLNKTSLLLFFYLFSPFGLFVLIKGSMFFLYFSVTFFCVIFFLINRMTKLALVCSGSLLTSLIVFWLAADQSLIYLPNYLISSFFIAAGFSEAMSTTGSNQEVLFFLAAASLILLFIIFNKQIPTESKIFLFCIYFIFLFISFKTGFTRHVGHAYIPGTSILLAGIFTVCIFNWIIPYLLLFVSLITWHSINGHYTKISLHDNFKSTYTATSHGLKSRVLDPSSLEENFTFTLSYLRDQVAFPLLSGTTDIYSYNQSYLIATQNHWSPRPVFQSYSVFTTQLAKNNKMHLQTNYRPDNIIFKIEPIDGRVPSLEDGASWPLLLTHYKPIKIEKDFLFLRKRNNISATNELIVRYEQHRIGELVPLPKEQKPIFATIEIQPTVWGKLAILLFKPDQLQMTFNLNNGMTKHYRLISSMAKSGFLLSPLIENTTEFSLLYQKDNALNEKEVNSFMITSNQNNNWSWNSTYTVAFSQI